MARIVQHEGGRRDVVAPAPDFDLRLAVFRRRLRLVQPLQCAVVPFVQPPVVHDGNPHPVEHVEHNPQGPDGALEHGRVRQVDSVAAFSQKPAGVARFDETTFRQIDVRPPGEPVLPVPCTLAVTEQNKVVHVSCRARPFGRADLPGPTAFAPPALRRVSPKLATKSSERRRKRPGLLRQLSQCVLQRSLKTAVRRRFDRGIDSLF